jgi:hypothetical protein
VVPFPSNVLHSTEDAATKILVPGFTVHDGTLPGPNGVTVPPPRSQHPNAAPPVPNEFWADGVSSTVVPQRSEVGIERRRRRGGAGGGRCEHGRAGR